MPQPKDGSSRAADGAMRIDPGLVRELAELLTANALTEVEVEDGDRRIRVARDPAPVFGTTASAPMPVAAPAPSATTAPQPAAAAQPPTEEVSGEAIKSPMVGTAYLSAEPGGKPFVNAGDSVKAGDTLVIVEAMKVMNPITAPSGGVVKKILISDGQPVVFDQPLIVIG
ncbi:MAG TPA: acetyl-CoA carboxylase biotin carboxyl carrier protein [Sphingomicrobium sp.]|nr:acetyl-CoA carboxylase biotin carboxyl carrier protein [Sphingomicrobium sp.]